ncbi:hypothetical protein DT076_09075 [Desertihabitans brevis]|uniref:Uncharacterized protein n=1 Tax=Desertihabitans brevis TaxID=2268447 RepID=A0A367YUN8_9ACTN|nr:hypothetical protein [Desertihabitans brevis]RCK69605.1 hypothetical protein DT076_09075 [Desertihabitans brevis]
MVAARPGLARSFREMEAGGLVPIDHHGHGYYLLVDQHAGDPARKYAVGDDGGLYWAPIADRDDDPARDAHTWVIMYGLRWLALDERGRLLARWGEELVPVVDKVRTDLAALRERRTRR